MIWPSIVGSSMATLQRRSLSRGVVVEESFLLC